MTTTQQVQHISPPETKQPFTVEDLQMNPARSNRQKAIAGVFAVTAVTSIAISGLILWTLLAEAWVFMVNVDWASVWDIGWFPRRGIYDIKTLIVASLITTGIAMMVATPLGLGAAIYLSEYAHPRVRSVIKPVLEVLAGIPSVVLGFFALLWIAPNVVGSFSANDAGSLAAAGIGVGILTIPLITSVSEDAMAAVPSSLREASQGLGARKSATTLRVVLPAAISGIVASLIIAVSRAIGETMVVYIAGGAAQTAIYTDFPTEKGLTMTAAMASQGSGTDNVVGEGLTFQSLYFVGLVLFVFTLGLNVIASRFVNRIQEKY